MLKIVRVQAIWCSSCLYMSKVWDKVMKNKKDIEVINLDYDLDRDIIKEFKVSDNLPAFMFFKDGKEVKRTYGEVSEKKLNKIIEELRFLTY